MKPFPWVDAIGFGLGTLCLSPRDFWAMTPRELAYAIRAMRGEAAQPPGRDTFDDMMRRFPDPSHANEKQQ